MQKFSTPVRLASILLSTIVTTVFALSVSSAASAEALSNADAVSGKKAVAMPNTATKKSKNSKARKKLSNDPVTNAKESGHDVQHHTSTEYKCELGNTLVMYAQAQDTDNISMRWKNQLYRLSRISTSTGAQRFEDQRNGLVWINIPAKGMLLDSLRGRQLANECKSIAVAMTGDKESGSSTTLAK